MFEFVAPLTAVTLLILVVRALRQGKVRRT